MKFNIPLLIMLCYAYTTSAQNTFPYHQNQILLNLKELPQDEIDDLIEEFEVQELWISPLTETRCWYFSSFPDVHEIEIDDVTVNLYNIIDAAELVKNRSSGGTSGVTISINPLPNYPIANIGLTTGYFNPNLFIENGTNEVLLSILDSGITDDVDDSQGYPYDPEIVSNTNYVAGSPQEDENGHGTHVGGIANFISNGNSPGSNVIDIEIRKILNENNNGNLGTYIRSIEDAIVSGAKILNLSLSFPEVEGNYFVNILVKLLEDNNLLGVVAAGNDGLNLSDPGLLQTPFGKNIFPAALQSPNLITVASVSDKTPRLSSFSNYGIYNVDVAAVGELVAGYNTESVFLGMSGTSQATAIVSGIAANLATYQTTFDGAAIKCAILSGVDPAEGLIGKVVSEGVVNAQTALDYLLIQTNCQDDGSDRIAPPTLTESKIYPNPFNSVLYMQLEEGINEITISDMLGKVLFSSLLEVSEGGILHQNDEVQTLPTGVYLLTIQNKLLGNNYTTKLFRN